MQHTSNKLVYSVREAVEATTFCKSTLYKLMACGELESRRIGSRRVITADSLHRLIGKAA